MARTHLLRALRRLARDHADVGQYHTFGGYERVRQGNIHFAGEHCSTDFQGYMEGGAEQGARAAEEILDDFRESVLAA